MSPKHVLEDVELPGNSKESSDRYLRTRVLPHVRDAYEEAARRGMMDTMGGMHPYALAELTGCDTTVARNWMNRLCDMGFFEKTDGLGYDTHRPRQSFVPADQDK